MQESGVGGGGYYRCMDGYYKFKCSSPAREETRVRVCVHAWSTFLSMIVRGVLLYGKIFNNSENLKNNSSMKMRNYTRLGWEFDERERPPSPAPQQYSKSCIKKHIQNIVDQQISNSYVAIRLIITVGVHSGNFSFQLSLGILRIFTAF